MINREYQVINGHKVFDTNARDEDYKISGFEELYKNEEKHFWFITRKELIKQCMNKYINKDAKIIEVGAGTGNVTKCLIENGYSNISVGEMHISALDYAKSYGIKDRFFFDLLDSPFVDEFECVCAFDVIEHIENDHLAIQNISQSIIGGGNLIISVPALNFLWNEHDVDVGHKRRYSKASIKKLLEENGFEIKYIKYFFIFIIPLLILRAIIKKPKANHIPKGDKIDSINPIINNILIFILKIENRIINYLPNFIGGSLLVVATKK